MNEWNKEIQNENELQVVISVSKAEELGKWLGILFWMVIPSIAGAVLSNQAVAAWLPFFVSAGADHQYGYAVRVWLYTFKAVF